MKTSSEKSSSSLRPAVVIGVMTTLVMFKVQSRDGIVRGLRILPSLNDDSVISDPLKKIYKIIYRLFISYLIMI